VKARVFRSGNSQAARLPKQFQFKSKEVGDEVVLREMPASLARAFHVIASLPDDLELPKDDLPRECEGF
jgi:antitoxin VapB